MSFKKFSTSQAASNNDKSADKAKTAPASGKPASPPAQKQDKAAPVQKS